MRLIFGWRGTRERTLLQAPLSAPSPNRSSQDTEPTFTRIWTAAIQDTHAGGRNMSGDRQSDTSQDRAVARREDRAPIVRREGAVALGATAVGALALGAVA